MAAVAPPAYAPGSWLGGLYGRLTPSEGWYTLVLLLGSLLALVWAVERADWVDSPSLAALMIWSVLAGLAVAKVRRYALPMHLASLVGGAALVYWRTADISDLPSAADRFVVVNQRVSSWTHAATGGGISTDTIVFVLALGGLAWIIGYSSSWAIFRHRSLWGGILPGAIGHLTNLSYLPDTFVPDLFLYLFFALLLAIRMTSLERTSTWGAQYIRYPDFYGPASIYHALWYVFVVLLVAVVAPFQTPVSPWLRSAWNDARSPLDDIEVHMARLFSGLPGRKPAEFRTFGAYLPFQGAISLGNQPLFLVDAPSPAYWRAQVYSVYTSQGWIAGDTEARPPGWTHPLAAPEDARAVTEMEYTVTSLVTSSGLPTTSLTLRAPRGFALRVLAAKSYWLPIESPPAAHAALPDDLAASLDTLSRLHASGVLDGNPAAMIRRALPADVVVTVIAYLGPGDDGEGSVNVAAQVGAEEYLAALEAAFREVAGELVGLQVSRRPPAPADALALTGARRVSPGDAHTLTARRSGASEGDLREASDDYPGWVTDTYLQLPDSLPDRVRELAAAVTSGAGSPYDKAVAIEEHLQSLTYDLGISPPPFDGDGVDHLLFTLRRGYSDYFGSSMAVMLRAVGVPARMVAGYATGERERDVGSFVVRDRDSHGWAEAYFPGYGWVEFEPTPGNMLPTGPRGSGEDLDALLGRGGDGQGEFFEEDLLVGETTILGEGQRSEPGSSGSAAVAAVSVGLAVAVAGLGLWLSYRQLIAVRMTPDGIYGRVLLLGRLAGRGREASETPSEFVRRLGEATPEASADLRFLGEAHARALYGGKGASEDQDEQLARAWGRSRRRLMMQVLWRLSPLR
jgi:transglutaminase-like putative cysteine protease